MQISHLSNSCDDAPVGINQQISAASRESRELYNTEYQTDINHLHR